MRILITGGAGFVGSSLAKLYKEKYPNAEVVALDNLKRRGSEFNLPVFKEMGIQFVHGDIRVPSDLDLDGNFDVFVEASAEPSVLAGLQGDSPNYAIQTNLTGTTHCLEFARKSCGAMVFLSTSRVYSVPELRGLKLNETDSRFSLEKDITEDFPTTGFRSIYGSSKLGSEQMVQEYVHGYGLKAVIDRSSIICGPGQFGKVDQGVFTLWVANHVLGKPLKYTGFGGKGKQVRDFLHPKDLFELVEKQVANIDDVSGDVFNIGGGRDRSSSLLEWTKLCQEYTGKTVKVGSEERTADVDVPYYVTDYSKASNAFGWQPKVEIKSMIEEIASWVKKNEKQLRLIF